MEPITKAIICFAAVAFLMGMAAGPLVHPYLSKDFPKWCADHGAYK